MDGTRNIEEYIKNNTLAIYKDDGTGQYVPTESVVEYLLEKYYELTITEIHNLFKLKDDIIKKIVLKIPKSRMNDIQKDYIINYLISQRDKMFEKEKRHEK